MQFLHIKMGCCSVKVLFFALFAAFSGRGKSFRIQVTALMLIDPKAESSASITELRKSSISQMNLVCNAILIL